MKNATFFNTISLACCSLFLQVGLYAQTIQRGIVMEMNSGNKPITAVSVITLGAIPTDSDNDGKFQLSFWNKKPGDRIVVKQVYKHDYEIVNKNMLEDWVLSEKKEFKIVLCKIGLLDESRRRFYNIGIDRYYSLYQQAKKELNISQQNRKITINQYNEKLKEINAEYKKAISNLDFYADKFARINKDDLNELDNKALTLVEEGKIDDAIKLYEDAQILHKFKEKNELHDTIHYNTQLLAEALEKEILVLKNSHDSIASNRIDSIYRVLIRQDDQNYCYYKDYARFILSCKKIENAFPLYLKALSLSRNKTERNEMCEDLDKLLSILPRREMRDKYDQQIKETLRVLDEKEELENLKK